MTLEERLRTLYLFRRYEVPFLELEKNPKSIVHWMAYPGPGNIDAAMRGQSPPEALFESLTRVLDDDYFQAIEITHPHCNRG